MTQKFVIIGAGNVATYFAHALVNNGYQVLQVYSRQIEKAKSLADSIHTSSTDDLNSISKEAGIYLFAVKDEAIEAIVRQLNVGDKLVAHTSGTQSIQLLNKYFKRAAVFYPLQTFTSGIKLSQTNFPIFIECSNNDDEKLLLAIAAKMGNPTHLIDEEKRKYLHLAAVFASNFTNLMWNEANDILAKKNMQLDLLMPLILETIQKLNILKPVDAQTGPAKRMDYDTISKHEELLNGNEQALKIYQLISQSIIDQQKNNH